MKKALKYTLTALAATAFVAPVYATDIVNNLMLRAAATYTEASNNGLNFAWTPFVGTAANPGVWRPLFVEPDHEWDYFLGLGYRISGTNTRVVFEYDHFRDTESRRATAAASFGVPVNSGNTVDASVTHKERDFKFGLRHTLEFGPKFDLVLGGLLQYTKAQRTFVENFYDANNNVSYHKNTLDESEGWGPHVDALGRGYPWGRNGINSCWSIWAHGGVGLLYTDQLYRMTTQASSNTNPAPFLQNGGIDPEEAQAIVAKIEADMGIEFTRAMRADFADMQLGIRLGLRYHNMLNAFKNGDFTQTYPNTGGAAVVPPTYNSATRDDYGRMGAFLEFRLGGANA